MNGNSVRTLSLLIAFFSLLSPLSGITTDASNGSGEASPMSEMPAVHTPPIAHALPTAQTGEVPLDFTHFVMGEFFTATWCGHCPPANEQLSDIYYNDSYQFYYVAMVCDKNDKASNRMGDYPTATGYPTVEFDGGYKENAGEHSDKSSYE